MEWLEHQRRQQVEKRLAASDAAAAVKVLIGLGWTAQNFSDVAAGLSKLSPSDKFVDVRLTPAEAIEILKALGGTVKRGATNGEIAGAIAQRGNLLNQKPRKGK
jgi:hypothetical protein